jgi:hypothetical protein
VIRAPYEMIPEGAWPFRMATSGPETDFWIYEDLRYAVNVGMASVGRDPDDVGQRPGRLRRDAARLLPAKPRLEDMDINHIERSLCFPTFPRFCGQTFYEAADKHLAPACVQAYNDWMVEEWCGDSGGRLLPRCLIPLWDVALFESDYPHQDSTWPNTRAYAERAMKDSS